MQRWDQQRHIGSVRGLPIRGNIVGFQPSTGTALVQLPLTQSNTPVPIKIPAGWVGPKGQISAGYPQRGTSIFCVRGQGNEWCFVGYDQTDSPTGFDGDGTRRVSPTQKLQEGRWLTLVENDINLIVDPRDGVIQGGSKQFTQADQSLGLWSVKFNEQMAFSEAHREITGPIYRDKKANRSRGVIGSSLTSHVYQKSLNQIGLDPKTKTSVSVADDRNPALTEHRQMFYEFIDSFGYTYDEQEERLYAGEDQQKTLPYQRKSSRTDTMSLSLDTPNYLAEIIIGTVVDIFGNILDLNRSILPSGIIESLNFTKSEDDKNIVFMKLKEQLRKSIAYHFEINARKSILYLPDYEETSNYATSRSRFFLDIDKEGQFKMNVPASSEVGNVSVLVRHENFSNLKGAESEEDRGQFLRNVTNNQDVQLEPHGKGVVDLTSNEETLKSFSAPINRFDGTSIKLGTAYHEISNVLMLHKFEAPYVNNGGYEGSLINLIDPVEDVISPEIVVSGDEANAGGRSGTISMDGMLSLSIGANTVDRQSLWLDCAGGIVGAIGRDKFHRSLAATLDGDIFLQVGGVTISDDSRFPSAVYNNEARDGTIDIRVWNSGSFHTIRIDPEGIKIHTPQRIDIVSEGEMRFKSVNSNMYFDAESIFFYSKDASHSRMLLRASDGSAGRTI
jgi:hypothetical protein